MTSVNIAVRLLVFTALEKWEMGKEIAWLIDPAHPLFEREAARRFHLAHAEHLCGAGNFDLARESIHVLSTVWREGKGAALTSKRLEPIWV